MRRLAGAILTAAFLAGPAAAQLSEEVVEVPTSRETREAAGPAAPESDDWREAASPYDVERIDQNDAAYAAALKVAREAGTADDQTELLTVLSDLPQPIAAEELAGDWECRTIRIGGEPAGLRIYGWWRCQIAELSGGLLLEKLTGSELSSGYLFPEGDTRMVYLGHRHGRNEPAASYDGPAGPEGDVPENPDDPGILTQRGPDRLLLVKPRPTIEASDYDILELRR